MTNDIGAKKRESVYDVYRGKWVFIYPVGVQSNFGGRVADIRDGHAILNPFQSADIKEGELVRIIREDNVGNLVPLEGSIVTPTTEEYIRNYCELMNKKDREESKEAEKNKGEGKGKK